MSSPPNRIYLIYDNDETVWNINPNPGDCPEPPEIIGEYVLRDASANATRKVIEDRVAKALDDFIEGKYIVDDLEEILAILKEEASDGS